MTTPAVPHPVSQQPAARLLGWSTLHCLYAGAIVAISSTTIVIKSFDERRVRGTVRDTVLGILIVDDLLAILIMAVLTALARGSGLDAAGLAVTTLRLAAFLAGLVVVGLLVVPRAIRAIERLNRPETTLIASIGICFATALLARKMGYALALGAFVAGALVAESGDTRRIQPLVRPIRDLFVAIFFVSVGMSIDPQSIAQHWPLVVLFTGVVVLGKVGGVTLGVFLMGHGVRTSVQAGMSLAQIGELSFVVAASMKEGALDYLTNPIDLDELLLILHKVFERSHLILENRALKAQLQERYTFSNIIYGSPKMEEVIGLVGRVAPSQATVLIRGQSGTGKELIANAIHYTGPRSQMPLVKVNCSAIPETLLESELFGHEKGAFTGAAHRRIGRFEEASGRTIFLDEIGDLSPGTQVKLLRILQAASQSARNPDRVSSTSSST